MRVLSPDSSICCCSSLRTSSLKAFFWSSMKSVSFPTSLARPTMNRFSPSLNFGSALAAWSVDFGSSCSSDSVILLSLKLRYLDATIVGTETQRPGIVQNKGCRAMPAPLIVSALRKHHEINHRRSLRRVLERRIHHGRIDHRRDV